MTTAVADVIAHLSDLPPFPKVTSKLLAMLDDPMVSMDQLADLVSTDPSLVMKVIYISNSPFYMISRPIQSVKEAVFILGINTIKSITTALSIQKGLSVLKPTSDEFDMDAFWKHSYATAVIVRRIAAATDKRLADRVYLIGLIHDVGKVIQAYYWPETWTCVMNTVRSGGETFDEAQRLFTWNHRQITVALCRNWRFPDDIVSVLEEQAQPTETEGGLSDNAGLLSVANRLAESSGIGFPPSEPLDSLPHDLERYAELAETLEEDVAHMLRVFN